MPQIRKPEKTPKPQQFEQPSPPARLAVKAKSTSVPVKRRAKPGASYEEGEINILRTTKQRLLDRKILRGKPVRSWEYILVAVLLGIVVGGGAVVYLAVSRSPVAPTASPEIIIPEEQEGSAAPPPPLPPEEASVVEIQKVEILQTPTGFLNVRSGPGTNYQKIGAVNPGEIYDLVSQDLAAGWYEIRLAQGSTGWVTKQYAKVK